MMGSSAIIGVLVAYGVVLSYLAVRDHPIVASAWFNLPAITVTLVLFAYTIHTTMAGLGLALPICLLFLGIIVAASHGVYLAAVFSHTLLGLTREMRSENAITVRPTFDKAAAAAARCDYAEAERLYREAIEAHPDDPTPHLRLADLHVKQAHLPQAATHLRQAASLADGAEHEAAIVFRLAELLAKRIGKADEARAALEAFIAKHPNTKYAEFARERIKGLA